MRITRIDLREIRLELISAFETSFGRTTSRRIILVQVFDEAGECGWGECTAPEGPFFSHEFVDGAWEVLERFLIPMVLGRTVDAASEIGELMTRVRGHGMARGGLEAACWDLDARRRGMPLWKLVGGHNPEIACGVSIGIQPSVAVLLEKVELELAAGYRRIKLKIKPGLEREIAESARSRFPSATISVDANSAYRLEDIALIQALDDLQLLMIEQPLDADDLVDHATLQREIRTPLCLDESITSASQARRALDLGACRIINIKLGRVGGFAEAKAIHDGCQARGVPVWCGGMLESGIGRAHNIALSTLPGFTLPGDVSASRRYWQRDIIHPEVRVSPQGTITAPENPGLGFEIDSDYVEQVTGRRLSRST
ncbi:MAG: o-succinylbenzoate synthase [Acidobacteria bacterium]|nr:o-succinylbenzoate synthase [Acidobacteriota bacterium]